MTVRVNVNALKEDFERASGSCMIAAKSAEGEEAAFLAGAACALDAFPSCRKPEEFGSLVGTLFEGGMARLGGAE